MKVLLSRHVICMMSLVVVGMASLSLIGGCATAPLGPTVQVVPPPGKPLDLFQQEVEECKKWAFDQMGGQAAVDDANQRAIVKGVLGTLLGTAAGAALGAGVGNAGAGAGIGAGAGMVGGAGAGAASSANSTLTLQQLYNNAFVQCMYAKGNQVPGEMPAIGSGPAEASMPEQAGTGEAAPSEAVNVNSALDTLIGKEPEGTETKAVKGGNTIEAQGLLNKKGYNCGIPDGKMGRKTREAIKNFQRNHQIEITGTLTLQTMQKLREP
jgi:hypothetical protein